MRRVLPIVMVLLAVSSCGGDDGEGATGEPPVSAAPPTSSTSVPMTAPMPTPTTASTAVGAAGTAFVLADEAGRVGVVGPDGAATEVRSDWSHRMVGLDASFVVSTVTVGTGDTKVAWDALPSAEPIGGLVVSGYELVPAATQVGTHVVALVNPAEDAEPGTIAGGRTSSTIMLASPESGVVDRFDLGGNLVPEAIGATTRADGLPAQIFLLEYLPAEAPTRYRVQVLDTATRELHLPANLRDKLGPRIDQEMAGISRDQVLAADDGLLFTLYRGTSDMPHGHPYAFVHTLDLFDGVWCLDVPDAMELEHLPGAVATSGDRLYVASANGTVGAYDIGGLREPSGSVEMLWVAQVVDPGGEEAPAIAAGPDGAVVTWPWMSGMHRVAPDGTVGPSTIGPPGTEAVAMTAAGPVAVGTEWWQVPGARPTWLGPVTRLIALPA